MEQVSLLRGLGWVQFLFGAMANQTDRKTGLMEYGSKAHLMPRPNKYLKRHPSKYVLCKLNIKFKILVFIQITPKSEFWVSFKKCKHAIGM